MWGDGVPNKDRGAHGGDDGEGHGEDDGAQDQGDAAPDEKIQLPVISQ